MDVTNCAFEMMEVFGLDNDPEVQKLVSIWAPWVDCVYDLSATAPLPITRVVRGRQTSESLGSMSYTDRLKCLGPCVKLARCGSEVRYFSADMIARNDSWFARFVAGNLFTVRFDVVIENGSVYEDSGLTVDQYESLYMSAEKWGSTPHLERRVKSDPKLTDLVNADSTVGVLSESPNMLSPVKADLTNVSIPALEDLEDNLTVFEFHVSGVELHQEFVQEQDSSSDIMGCVESPADLPVFQHGAIPQTVDALDAPVEALCGFVNSNSTVSLSFEVSGGFLPEIDDPRCSESDFQVINQIQCSSHPVSLSLPTKGSVRRVWTIQLSRHLFPFRLSDR